METDKIYIKMCAVASSSSSPPPPVASALTYHLVCT